MQKISGIQTLFLMTTFDVGMSLMAMITPTVQKVHQDAWISIIIATVASMLFTYLAVQLSSLYPERSFAGCFKGVFGPILGIPIVAIYAIQWTVVTGMAVRQIVDFAMPTLQLYNTPFQFVILCILALSAYAILAGGIESLGRSSEIITPLVLGTLTLALVISFRVQPLDNLLPILRPHLAQSLISGAIPAASFLTQGTVVMVMYPYLSDQKSRLAGVWGTGIAGVILMLATIETTSIFGPTLPSRMWNPFFMLMRFISIANFIQNVDSIIVVIWFFSAFIRIAVYAWVASQVTTDLIGVNVRLTTVFISICAFVISLLPSSIVVSTKHYPTQIVEPFVLPVLNIGLPVLGLLIAMLRKRIQTE
ncbi:endospore germination permease [Alicyclobacillus sp. SO9]|uniref:GerAB/ArcD/ProY family transporter n=1 Tax=Alicyclobacillus sp. SO9 TaxID=2665646 RepID=UPI0018E70682|nr:endospore germination permease [Alicyclobacillus sp. SO9]QQE79656.1 endospore germination permease [Alicyclobacillus sp. SO9]